MGSYGGGRSEIKSICVVGAGPSGQAASKYVFSYLLPVYDTRSLKDPPGTSLPRTALKQLTSLNSRLPLEASGITRTTPSTRLVFPRRIHISLWTNRSGALSQIEIALKEANKRLHSCHQCMSVWRPIFHIVS